MKEILNCESFEGKNEKVNVRCMRLVINKFNKKWKVKILPVGFI